MCCTFSVSKLINTRGKVRSHTLRTKRMVIHFHEIASDYLAPIHIYIDPARSLSEWADCHIRMANTYIHSCALFGQLTARIINNTLLRADGIIVQSHFHFQAHHLIYWRFTCARLRGQAFSSRVVVRVTDFPRYFQKTTSPNTHKTPQLHWLIAFSGRVHH